MTSALWLTAMLQLSGIPGKLMEEVKYFCDAPVRSKPFIFLFAIYMTLVLTGILFGPVHGMDLFQLYSFPVVFRAQQLAIVVAATVVMILIRHFLEKHPQDRVAPS